MSKKKLTMEQKIAAVLEKSGAIEQLEEALKKAKLPVMFDGLLLQPKGAKKKKAPVGAKRGDTMNTTGFQPMSAEVNSVAHTDGHPPPCHDGEKEVWEKDSAGHLRLVCRFWD